jgi:hypothetical protein
MRFNIPVRGRGAVRIASQKVIRHYPNAGVAIAAGAESEWFTRTVRMRRTDQGSSSISGALESVRFFT